MKKQTEALSIELVKKVHAERGDDIRKRLGEFSAIWKKGDDKELWLEMVYCFFTGGCSAKMGLKAVEAIRPIIDHGTREEITIALLGVHRYPNARAGYVVHSRDFLQQTIEFRLKEKLTAFECDLERRDWLVKEKGIKGLGYKEASHYLRNIGLFGYAILDKHVLSCMAELGVIDDPKPPGNRTRYLKAEAALKDFSAEHKIDFDELDLVLWSIKTGEILK